MFGVLCFVLLVLWVRKKKKGGGVFCLVCFVVWLCGDLKSGDGDGLVGIVGCGRCWWVVVVWLGGMGF